MSSESMDSMPSLRELHQQIRQSQAPPQQSQNMQSSFTAADNEADSYNPMMREASPLPLPQYQPNSAGSDPAENMNMPVKRGRGRGRPRKYEPCETSLALALGPGGPSFTVSQPSGSRGRFKKVRGRGRGRPSSSANRDNLQGLASTGVGFRPLVLTVLPGEDILTKIMGLNMNELHSVCVLSAFGCISDAILRHPTSSSGTVSYQGRFNIISLSGSFVPVKSDGRNNITGGLSVALSRHDGGVFGGGVAGPLIAATHVQIVAGSSIPEGPDQYVEQTEAYIPTPTLSLEDPTKAQMAPGSPQFRSVGSSDEDEIP